MVASIMHSLIFVQFAAMLSRANLSITWPTYLLERVKTVLLGIWRSLWTKLTTSLTYSASLY